MALPNNTFASPGVSFYATAGESAKNWYNYPALNGTIQLVDASGTQLLRSIDADLFYNDELLAKASDIQDVADWSLYPALQSVELAGQDIIQANNITATSTITANVLDASSATITGVITANTFATVPGPFTSGNVKTQTVTASGLVSAGSVSASGNVQGGSMTTTGGLDMANTAVTRATAVNISANGFAPYGALSSPDGTLLTWNGATINTGGAGSAANWANFPAVANINANTNDITNIKNLTGASANITDATIGTMSLGLNQITGSSATPFVLKGDDSQPTEIMGGSITETSTTGDITLTSYNSVNVNSGNDFTLVADGGINPIITPTVSLNAKNGNGGRIDVIADPGSIAAFGGRVDIIGNGGTINIPQPPPELPISVTVGGEVNITANTGSGAGIYTATSAINLNAASINSYAGAIPPFGSVLGYNFIYANLGVNIASGLPSAGFQLPFTTYIYGTGVPLSYGGVRLQSPNGIQMLSDTYMTNLYPLDTDGLNISGRAFLGTGNVNIEDVQTFEMNGGAALKTDNLTSVSGSGILYTDTLIASGPTKGIYTNFIKPSSPTAPGTPNLVISSSSFGGTNNYVQIQNADTIAFDATGTGALSGVQSINGAAWPPPTGDASLWSQYPATSIVDISGFGLTNVSSINGVPYVPSDTDQWATYPAVQTVDLSGNSLTNVNDISIVSGATIVGAGALDVTVAGDFQLITSGGGEINLSTGGEGDINITTGGTGNEVTITGDIVNIDSTLGVRLNNNLDMTGNDVINVAELRGSTATTLNINSSGLLDMTANGNANLTSTAGSVVITGNLNTDILATVGAVNLTAETSVNLTATTGPITMTGVAINLEAPVAVGTVGSPQDVTVNGSITATVDVVSSSGTDNYSLNTIGALVGGIPSGFRDATEFYVSFDGSDTTGLGSILSPYQTIQKAITQAELVSSAAQVCNINVASGHYTENLVFNKGYVVLTGTLQSQTGNEVCEITGSITINCVGANDVFNRQVTFQGFNISCGVGQSITNTSSSSHTVSFQDCKIFVNSVCYNSTASCADARTYFTNVEISSTNAANVSPVITTNVGLVELERLDLTVDGNAIGVLIGGTSVLNRFSLSTLESTNTGTTLLPLLSFTSTSTSAHSLGNVAFAFTSAVAKTATNAVYINSGINTAIIMLNNVFTLTGTASSTNNCVGYSGVGSPTIAGVNNTSLNVNVLLPQTVSVQSGITQIAYTDINPPNMACYSTTGDQSIAAVNTPQAVTFNTTQFQQGTALLASSRFYVSSQGNYQITWSLMLSQGSGTALVTSFLKKNGTTVANTGSQTTTFSGSNSLVQVSPNFILSLNAGDYVELWVGSNSLGTTINSTGATNGNAATPGAVFNITQIR